MDNAVLRPAAGIRTAASLFRSSPSKIQLTAVVRQFADGSIFVWAGTYENRISALWRKGLIADR